MVQPFKLMGRGGYDLKKKYGFHFVERQKSEHGTGKKILLAIYVKKKKKMRKKIIYCEAMRRIFFSENENFSKKKWIRLWQGRNGFHFERTKFSVQK